MTPNKLLRNYTGQAIQNTKRISLPLPEGGGGVKGCHLLFPPPPKFSRSENFGGGGVRRGWAF